MLRRGKRFCAFLLAFLMIFTLVRQDGTAVLENVYFTAVNDKLMPLNDETMPFWSNNALYVSYTVFDRTDLDVQYIRNYSMGLAVLYTSKMDLRFDLANQTVYDRNGVFYNGNAIEKNGHVFFPLGLVCQYFGLSWTLNNTATVPLIRVKSDAVVLDDNSFLSAAATMMASRYAEYEKLVSSTKQPEEEKPPRDPEPPEKDPVVDVPPIHAADGQKLYLIFWGKTEDSIREWMRVLADKPATFLLTVQQMENGDLVRALLGSGHTVALHVRSGTDGEICAEVLRARELVWMASCTLLQLVWYEGGEDVSALFTELGCVSVSAEIDRRAEILRTDNHVDALMRQIGKYQEDLSVCLSSDETGIEGLRKLLGRLEEAQYRLCAWRLTYLSASDAA